MSTAASLGYPRIGKQRELKFALEKYWAGKIPEQELQAIAAKLRKEHWSVQARHGIEVLPSNDFSLNDQVLDTAFLCGAIPQRFKVLQGKSSELELYFALARGWQEGEKQIAAMEMTKWFDTNYHYLVPEIAPNQEFRLNENKPISEFKEAQAAGFTTRPVLLGPVSFLLLSKPTQEGFSPLQTLPELLSVYSTLLAHLAMEKAEWVQIDEPCLVLDLDEQSLAAFQTAYEEFHQRVPQIKVMLTTYFGGLGANLARVAQFPVDGLHLDLVRDVGQIDEVLNVFPRQKMLSLGLVNGRNVWRTPLQAAILTAQKAASRHGRDTLQIAPSCSLLFSPYDVELEESLDLEIRSWLAFAEQKLSEVAAINAAVNDQAEPYASLFTENRQNCADRSISKLIHNVSVQKRGSEIKESDYQRSLPFAQRKQIQQRSLRLPWLPTTTIGSFPQTAEIRKKRALFKQGSLSAEEYQQFIEKEIRHALQVQEKLGLDVLVHGEPERTDMVEYFAEQLNGFAFTQHGWVQSYGSRAVRPPILYGDVSRPAAMTVRWAKYAQSQTSRPVKGMLTGPITLLQWSFVRDDQPRAQTCCQLALALRDEVNDLQNAGLHVIQIDEPALREGLPLRRTDWPAYLDWAVACFRLVAGVAREEIQIHTHMCYAEFNDIIGAIARMDADVISIEASRSNMGLLDAFHQFHYPNDIGPGVYDIHSPRVPSRNEMAGLLQKALEVIPAERLWVNPDCGLKTRRWEEVIPALSHMVEAAQMIRESIEISAPADNKR